MPPERFLHPALPEATTLLTWNVAAVNNNPFEYWITYDDPVYVELMRGVEEFLDKPADKDVEVSTIFTEGMFQELKGLCAREGMVGLEELDRDFWRGKALGLATRKIVTEFIRDPSLGAKRLISMPDRITNTVNVVARSAAERPPAPACRPCVINNYNGDLSRREVWWEKWKTFMFEEALTVRTRAGVAVQRPVEMLDPIPRSKYPAITEDEERLAIPLQILCQAIFDAILVHLMNMLSPDGSWQAVKAKICDRLFTRKQAMTIDILANRYSEVQVICLQEAAAVFMDAFALSPLARTHELAQPAKLDGKRDQNSLILLRKDAFRAGSLREVTAEIVRHIQGEMALADGDLLAVEAEACRDGSKHLLVSFHGDTNGQLTMPICDAVHRACQSAFKSHIVMLGLDANVYEAVDKTKKNFDEFMQEILAMGFTTCWGDRPDVSRCRTTCNARTSLQPQLNKAIRLEDTRTKSDMNPKDIILFYRNQLGLVAPKDMGPGRQENPMKDNTGRLRYEEACVFPTLEFPSDHGILAAALHPLGRSRA